MSTEQQRLKVAITALESRQPRRFGAAAPVELPSPTVKQVTILFVDIVVRHAPSPANVIDG